MMIIIMMLMIMIMMTIMIMIYNNSYKYPYEIHDFLSSYECDIIIKKCQNKLVKSEVYKGEINEYDKSRDSLQCWLNDSDPLIASISDRVAKLTNTNIKQQEILQVVKYNENGYFTDHFDACGRNAEFCKKMTEYFNGKDRLYTVLIYLNDDYEGGETVFPNINKIIKPEKGKAVVFKNIDHNDKIITQSLHRGNPIIKGVKYICNKWIHSI
jgi:hypothetical protein